MGISFIDGPGGCTLTSEAANTYENAFAEAKNASKTNEEAHKIAMATVPKRRK